MSRIKGWSTASVLMVAVAVQAAAQHAHPPALLEDYYAAFCRTGTPPGGFEFVIFPPGRLPISVAVPLQLGLYAYAPRAAALYVSSAGSPTCLNRIEFNPVSVVPVACPPGLAGVFNFVVSVDEDRALVSGHVGGNTGTSCGIFEVGLRDASIRQVVGVDDCRSYRYENSWVSLSLSPRGNEAVAVRHDTLELIDLRRGTTRVIADGVRRASWSPDGRWIAALSRHWRTELIDASDFKSKRTLAESQLQWSPDSRYLLRVKLCIFPIGVNRVGTVQALDINTGKTVTIENSRCAVNPGTTGWVSRRAVPSAGVGSPK